MRCSVGNATAVNSGAAANEHDRKVLVGTHMNPLRIVFVAGPFLCISALTLGIGACGGGGSSAAPPPVALPSYTLTASALSPTPVTAGNAATSAIELTPAHGYTGSISLSCGMISGGTHAPSCSFSPSTVTISGANPSASKLTVTTTANTPGGNYAITVNAIDAKKLAPSNGPQALTLAVALPPSYTLTASA